VSHARLRIAVPIAATGAKQAQLDGDVGEPGTEIRVVTRVTRFNRI
jgi:hypothetical protein